MRGGYYTVMKQNFNRDDKQCISENHFLVVKVVTTTTPLKFARNVFIISYITFNKRVARKPSFIYYSEVAKTFFLYFIIFRNRLYIVYYVFKVLTIYFRRITVCKHFFCLI